jgi:hypothetical protein
VLQIVCDFLVYNASLEYRRKADVSMWAVRTQTTLHQGAWIAQITITITQSQDLKVHWRRDKVNKVKQDVKIPNYLPLNTVIFCCPSEYRYMLSSPRNLTGQFIA